MRSTYFASIYLTLTTLSIMASKEIKTQITINASPQKVWTILSDFENYSSWNPFITSLEGDVEVGNKIKVNAGGMNFKPEVLAYKENKELRWIGKLLFSGVFDGEHSFELVDNQDGTTTFHHNEKFNGFLVGLFSKKLDTDTKSGFEAMNDKLKELAEQ